MEKKLITSFILSILILSLFSTGQTIQSKTNIDQTITSIDLGESQINLNQGEAVTSNQLISDSIEILKQAKIDNAGSWGFSASDLDPKVYYGQAGGMAGVGMKLLEALSLDVIQNDVPLTDNIINVTKEIGQELILAGQINGINAEWNITNSDNYVDLSWDFGLSGIAAFFTQLFNVTLDTSYQDVALKTLTSISELANTSNGLFWESQILDYIDNLDWYNPLDILLFSNFDSSSLIFPGLSLGTAGVAKSALSYLSKTSDPSNVIVTKMLNDSVLYLDNVANTTGNERSFLMAEEANGIESTSYGTGSSGIAQLYLDLFDFTSNSTYKDYTLEIVNWLNGTDNFQYKFHFNYIVNGSVDELDQSYELGFTFGRVGVIKTLFNIGITFSNSTSLQMSKELTDVLYFSRTETTNSLSFPERFFTDPQGQGSTSWSFGMAGIYPILYQIAENFTQNDSRERLSKMKNYIFSQVETINGLYGITSTLTGNIEMNPSVGIPGHLEMLSLKSIGKLYIQKDLTESLNLGTVEIGNSNTMSVVFENIGEADISVTWNETQITDDFTSEAFTTVLSEREQYKLNITFTPTIEAEKTTLWVIESLGTQFILNMKGIGFDYPIMDLTPSETNNSNFDSHRNIDFVLNVSDSSDISSVRVNLGETDENLIIDSASNTYKKSISTSTLSNGTYHVIFTASDVLGYSNQVIFTFTVGIYTSNIIDKITSDDTLYILIGAIVVVFTIAIFVTRRYMK